MKVIAIIPARGGSKGVPGKNKKLIDGMPLVSYTIEAAMQSKLLSQTWVSSDDPAIINIARQFTGIQIHERDASLATDQSPVTDTVKEIIKQTGCDAIMLLQPTAPIRTGENIDAAINLLQVSIETNSVISVVAMNDIHPARMYWRKDGILNAVLPEFEQARRQDIPPAYYRNGSIYLVRRNAFEEHHSVMVKPTVPYIMPLDWLLNIDEPRDMLIADALIPAWKKGLLG
ncbi:MAG: acylneuraminate cytidylyltransferase family protein [Ferruginibacter sp.]